MAKVIIMIHNVQEYVTGFSFIAVVCCNHKCLEVTSNLCYEAHKGLEGGLGSWYSDRS